MRIAPERLRRCFAPGSGSFADQCDFARKHAGYSYKSAAVADRYYRSIVRNYTPPGRLINDNETFTPAAESLAREYAVYKLAALHRMLGSGESFRPIAELSVGEA